jgi:hypothetical protein
MVLKPILALHAQVLFRMSWLSMRLGKSIISCFSYISALS